MSAPQTPRLRARPGAMTAEMLLHPSDFGLGRMPARLQPAATTRSVCGYCSTGCSLKIHLNAAGEAINLTADRDYPVNLGMACPKGWEALTPLAAPDRVTIPLLRDQGAPEGGFRPVSWSDALAAFTGKFKAIQKTQGPHAVAVLSTGQIVMEEMALLGALAKFGLGIRHLDSNTRQCMATSHVAYKQSFGFDAPPFTYADFEESDALVFIGANPCIAHPIMWQRVMMNRRQPDIVVIDPRATETAQAATLHVALRPKSDLTLLYGIAHLLIAHGRVKRDYVDAHTTGFDAFAAFVAAFPPERTAAETGVPIATLDRLATMIGTRERVSLWWTMGVNQSHEATRTAQAIINLALMTGNIGRPGTGANSITGQCNAMGSRLFGNATSLLGGYDFANVGHRARVAKILGLSPEHIPSETGYAYDQILEGIDRGEISGLWVIATNPAHSWINQTRAREILRKLEFLVVQDMYATTETAQLAHLILPAAGWGEKDGVLINSERRLGLVKKVARAPGVALSDFAIFKLIAHAWGCADMFRAWTSPEAAFQITKELSRDQPCDFSGIRDYAHLEAAGGIQWPFTAGESAEREVPGDGFDGTARAPGTTNGMHSNSQPSERMTAESFATPEAIATAKPSAAEEVLPVGESVAATEAMSAEESLAAAESMARAESSGAPARSAETETFGAAKTEAPRWGGPLPSSAPASIGARAGQARERRLFADGKFFTPDGRARFIFDPPRLPPELPDAAYPFTLLTGRGSSAQWHTGSRTNKSAVLRKLAPTTLTVEVHPEDAQRYGIAAGGVVRIVSRRGTAHALAVVTATVQPGQVFLPMHFGTVNQLTLAAFDPHSRQPSYKACAVAIAPAKGVRADPA